MKISKLLLAVVAAAVLLGALVSAASAGRLRTNADGLARIVWSRLDFRGGLGTVECEVTLVGTSHSNLINKINLSLLGLITAATVTTCRRGAATILRETLPWHIRYSSFSGTLPNITAISTLVIGASYRVSEPVFGIECLTRTTPEAPAIITYNRETGIGDLLTASASGTIRCGGAVSGSLSGTGTARTGFGLILNLTLI